MTVYFTKRRCIVIHSSGFMVNRFSALHCQSLRTPCYSYLIQQLECLHERSKTSGSLPSLQSADTSHATSDDSGWMEKDKVDDARHEILLAYNSEVNRQIERLRAIIGGVCG